MAEDRKEQDRNDDQKQKESDYHQLKQVEHHNADNDARWVKKSGRSVYGYKKHMATDDNGMILGAHTTTVNDQMLKRKESKSRSYIKALVINPYVIGRKNTTKSLVKLVG